MDASVAYPGVNFLSYDMTVSMFDTYLERATLYKVERIMDMSQASFYAQLTNDSRRKMWNNWQTIINNINTRMLFKDAIAHKENPILWNGQRMSIKGLVQKFFTTFGKKAVNS